MLACGLILTPRGRFAPLDTQISFLKKENKILKSGTLLNAHVWYIFKRPLTIEKVLNKEQLTSACLLCSEPLHTECHRRLVAEYFAQAYDLEVEHLV
jgi:uncharacterized protein (DUF488 family)